MIAIVHVVWVKFEADNTPESPKLAAITEAFYREVKHYPVNKFSAKTWRLIHENDHYNLAADVNDANVAREVEALMHRCIDGNGGKAVPDEG